LLLRKSLLKFAIIYKKKTFDINKNILNRYLSLDFVAINSNTNCVYIYKQRIILIKEIFSNKLNFEIYILDCTFKQYNRNIFVKVVSNIYSNTNNILLTKLKFINKYKYKILLNLSNII